MCKVRANLFIFVMYDLLEVFEYILKIGVLGLFQICGGKWLCGQVKYYRF